MVPPSGKRLMFITNPVSGSGRHHETEKIIRRTIHYRFDYVFEHSQYAGHARELAQKAVAEKFDAVIAVGGDGSVHEIGSELILSRTALGIIPTGSGNGVARSLKIPIDVEESIECINQWLIKTIDTGSVNSRRFIGIAGIGFEAVISRDFLNLKQRGFMNYVRLIGSKYLQFEPEEVILEIDSAPPVSLEIFTLAIANTSQYGNNAFIAPSATPDDGSLMVTAITPFNHIAAPALATRLFNKSIEKSPLVKTFKGKQLRIRRKSTLLHLDGEPLETDSTLEVAIEPKSLNVIVPAAPEE